MMTPNLPELLDTLESELAHYIDRAKDLGNKNVRLQYDDEDLKIMLLAELDYSIASHKNQIAYIKEQIRLA